MLRAADQLSGLLILKKSEQKCYTIMRMQQPEDLVDTLVYTDRGSSLYPPMPLDRRPTLAFRPTDRSSASTDAEDPADLAQAFAEAKAQIETMRREQEALQKQKANVERELQETARNAATMRAQILQTTAASERFKSQLRQQACWGFGCEALPCEDGLDETEAQTALFAEHLPAGSCETARQVSAADGSDTQRSI